MLIPLKQEDPRYFYTINSGTRDNIMSEYKINSNESNSDIDLTIVYPGRFMLLFKGEKLVEVAETTCKLTAKYTNGKWVDIKPSFILGPV